MWRLEVFTLSKGSVSGRHYSLVFLSLSRSETEDISSLISCTFLCLESVRSWQQHAFVCSSCYVPVRMRRSRLVTNTDAASIPLYLPRPPPQPHPHLYP